MKFNVTPNAKEDTTNSMLGYKECIFFLFLPLTMQELLSGSTQLKLMGTGKLTHVYISAIFRKNSSGDKSGL